MTRVTAAVPGELSLFVGAEIAQPRAQIRP
jgi:hypothetical protein